MTLEVNCQIVQFIQTEKKWQMRYRGGRVSVIITIASWGFVYRYDGNVTLDSTMGQA